MAGADRGAARPDRPSMCAVHLGHGRGAAAAGRRCWRPAPGSPAACWPPSAGRAAARRSPSTATGPCSDSFAGAHPARRPLRGLLRMSLGSKQNLTLRSGPQDRVSKGGQQEGGTSHVACRSRSTSSAIRWCSTSSPRCATRRRRAPISAACCARSGCCWATTPRATCRWCTTNIETPIAAMEAPLLEGKKLVIVPILRAGLGLAEGVIDLVPLARMGHVGLYRDPAHAAGGRVLLQDAAATFPIATSSSAIRCWRPRIRPSPRSIA